METSKPTQVSESLWLQHGNSMSVEVVEGPRRRLLR